MERPVIYDRQEELIRPPRCVHIVGCGGVGTWAAIMLAMAGVPHLHLYEDDTVEESNLNRLPYASGAIGKPKLELLSKMLHKLRPDVELTLHGRFEPLLHKFSSQDRVIGAVDTMRDRQQIYNACQETGVYYVDVGAESHHCTVSDSPAEWAFTEDRPGYFTPIWVAPVVVAAGLAVAAVVYGSIGTGDTFALDLKHLRREETGGEKTQSEAGAVVGEQMARPPAGEGNIPEVVRGILRREAERG